MFKTLFVCIFIYLGGCKPTITPPKVKAINVEFRRVPNSNLCMAVYVSEQQNFITAMALVPFTFCKE